MAETRGAIAFEIGLTPESVARWCIGRDGRIGPPPRDGDPVPLAYLVFLRAQPVLGIEMREHLGRDPDRGLYGGVSYRQLRPLRVGMRLSASGSITSRRETPSARGNLVLTTYTTRYVEGGIEHASEEVRMVDLPPPSASAAVAAPDQARHDSALPLLAAIEPFTRTQVAWLAVETGDLNALHFDAAYAAMRGFADVVVPGTLITAVIERELARAFAGPLRELSVRYHAPTHPGEPLALHAQSTTEGPVFELVAAGTLRAQGRFAPGVLQ